MIIPNSGSHEFVTACNTVHTDFFTLFSVLLLDNCFSAFRTTFRLISAISVNVILYKGKGTETNPGMIEQSDKMMMSLKIMTRTMVTIDNI